MDLPEDIIAELERRLGVRLDVTAVRTGAWGESAGHRTDRGTWVRVTSRGVSWIQPQSWIGDEAASVIAGVPKPAWHQSATWTDTSRGVVWRADEMDYVADHAVVQHGTALRARPTLPDTWWSELTAALSALACHRTFRVSGRQELITRRISQIFPDTPDTTVTEWTVAHGDLHWGNVTAPTLQLLDWGDWGLSPRGNDAACLWATSLAVPDVAQRVAAEFAADLCSRSGRIARLWVCSNLVRMADRREDARRLAKPAMTAARQLIKDLQ